MPPTTEHVSHLVSDPSGLHYTTDSTERHGKVVVALDGSAASDAVLAKGVQIANGMHASLVAVTAWTYPPYYGELPAADEISPVADAREILAGVSARAFNGDHPDWVSLVVKEGRAADVLIAESIGAEMLIVGSRGIGGLAGVLLGSVSARCAEHASCAVLVLH